MQVGGGKVRIKKTGVAAAAALGCVMLAAGCGSSGSSSTASKSANWATAASASAGGGMSALVAAAEKEGQLNVITLPSNWAHYGTIMKDFTARDGIKITEHQP